jgi:putative Mg2+ transporter-C (MgtC) family protein
MAGTAVVLLANTGLRGIGRAINAAPVSTADLVRQYVFTVVCQEKDEINIRAILSNALASGPLSFESLSSRDCDDEMKRVEVTATFRAHPTYQFMLEQLASRLSMEQSVSSVGWKGLDAEPTPE